MNKVIISGYVVRDAELNYIGEGVPKMSFCLGVNRSYQKDKDNKKSDFINFELFGKRAENLCKYKKKGERLWHSKNSVQDARKFVILLKTKSKLLITKIQNC